MADRLLFLLSPYRLPTHHQVTLADDEVNAWMHGFLALWHPALLHGAASPPRIDSPYDHEFPDANQVYALPSAPQLFQPDDWPERVRMAGAVRFQSAPDRGETLRNLAEALAEARLPDAEPKAAEAFATDATARLLTLPDETVRPFVALGFGYLMVESLFDAMDHEHLLDVAGFMGDIQAAISQLLRPEPGDWLAHCRDAAQKLLSAREVLYSVPIHLLDLLLVEPHSLPGALPESFRRRLPLNLLASGQALEALRRERPELAEALRQRVLEAHQPPLIEVCGGTYLDREDALLGVESQLWNLRAGKRATREVLGAEVDVHARTQAAFSPQTPQWLHATGFRNALLLNFDAGVIPTHRATLVNWPAPDGKAVDAFTRMPLPAHSPQTYFNLVFHLRQSIAQDSAPTLALLHRGGGGGAPQSPLYGDWLALTELGDVLGQWTTFSRYFSDAMAGEYTGPASADDFFPDDLEGRVNRHLADPVSGFARHARLRRRVDSALTLTAMYRALHAAPPTEEDRDALRALEAVEEAIETQGLDQPADAAESPRVAELARLEQRAAGQLAERLQVRAVDGVPGYLLLNPCSFPRRVALEIPDFGGPIPVEGPVKAGQFEGGSARLVVELSALGFAWIPRGNPRSAAPKARLRSAEGSVVRNEFFEAEVDPATGGLKSLRDTKTLVGRLGQQLVYNPGSRMECRNVRVTSAGSALGEITTEGAILGDQNEELATFRQRFRAWLGRPILEVRVEIEPRHLPRGYPWHSYYGARFAWRDERTALFRGVNGGNSRTTHARPQSPDYLELRLGRSNVAILPGGLPFFQKQGARMVDLVLLPEGEAGRAFEFALALDRENLTQTALGYVSPTPVVATGRGAPHVGPTGWLFHVDAPNLLMTSLRPHVQAGGAGRSVAARFLETTGYAGHAQFRCARDPLKAVLLDGGGVGLVELATAGDAAEVDFSGGELVRVRIDFD